MGGKFLLFLSFLVVSSWMFKERTSLRNNRDYTTHMIWNGTSPCFFLFRIQALRLFWLVVWCGWIVRYGDVQWYVAYVVTPCLPARLPAKHHDDVVRPCTCLSRSVDTQIVHSMCTKEEARLYTNGF